MSVSIRRGRNMCARDGRWQVRYMDQRSAGKGAGALQAVFQFADVARPVIGQHDLDSFVGKNFFLPRSARRALHEVSDEQRDILAALAQRRNSQAEDVETE